MIYSSLTNSYTRLKDKFLIRFKCEFAQTMMTFNKRPSSLSNRYTSSTKIAVIIEDVFFPLHIF